MTTGTYPMQEKPQGDFAGQPPAGSPYGSPGQMQMPAYPAQGQQQPSPFAPQGQQSPFAQQPGYPSPGQQPMYGQGPITTQPGASNEMRYNPQNLPRDANGKREWKHGLFDCTGDCGHFCISFWVPCFTYNQNLSRRRALENTNQPHPDGGEYIGSDCAIYTAVACVSGCFQTFLQMSTRSRIRERYGISGNGCGDCMSTCCCYACELTQESQEIAEEEQFLRKQNQGFIQ